MTRQEKVTIKIKKDGSGNMTFDLNGFEGSGCDVLKEIEEQMGLITHTEDTEDALKYIIPDEQFNELA